MTIRAIHARPADIGVRADRTIPVRPANVGIRAIGTIPARLADVGVKADYVIPSVQFLLDQLMSGQGCPQNS